ncbi:MAG: nucleoside:proton symporter [Gammaproteobacteria bacterium]|nr:nucleoside:proton symporter [Gammaproteobacteria bacterium]MYC25801.1 nucleoside:proton symporter [Gammaproteobacteria bacterium]
MHALLGIALVIVIAWLLSESKGQVRWLPVGITLGVQILLAAILLQLPVVSTALSSLNVVVGAITDATGQGTAFVFSYLGGGELPFALTAESPPFIFATQLLPQIIVFAVLVALLWYWRVLPLIIQGISWALQKTLRIGGAVAVAAAASVFVGMVEAPMMIRGYLKSITRSEFFVVITCGMATVAGSMMILYVTVVGDVLTNTIAHVITASLLNVLGGILIARIMIPDDHVTGETDVEDAFQYQSSFDALTRGAMDGTKIVINIIAMLIVLVSLVALINHVMSFLVIGGSPVTLERIASWLFHPLTWCMGLPWTDVAIGSKLMGIKLMINELVAFQQLGQDGIWLSDRSNLIMTYALCGFTNLGSAGILVGGVSALVPERREDLLSLAPRTLVSGTLVAFLTGSIVGVVSAFGPS